MRRASLLSWRRTALVAAGLALGAACIRRDADSAPADVASAPNAVAGAPSGVNMLESTGLRAFQLHGDARKASISFVKVEGQPFDTALRAEIRERSQQPWDLQLQTRTAAPVEKGDVLLATFFFRTEWAPQESGEGQTEFVFELAREPWTKSASYPVRASRQWKEVNVPFVAAESYPAGAAQAIFRLGYDREIIELGGLTLQNFGKTRALADLPRTTIEYGGMEPDAPWRKAALERIEKIRKADFDVKVTDRAGKPLAGAEVSAKLVRHAFGFGSCVPAALLLGAGNERFQGLVSELFNVATLENDLKWQPLAGDWGTEFTLPRAQAGVDWLRAHGLAVRGHVLVWPGWNNLPKSLKVFEKQPEVLRTKVGEHVRELASSVRGKLLHWDVVNEPFDNHDLLDILGERVMVDWFATARATDPAPKLFINDYAILSGGGGTTPHREHYEKTIANLVAAGAELDGIGMQGHFGTSLTSPDDMLAILDRFARFGKTIWITEYDVVVDDEVLAGRFTRDFYTTLFSHPAVGGIVMWGFWDGSHWKKNAPLYRADWSEKPAGKAYRDLVLGEWRTEARGTSDAAGVFHYRGYLGDYELSVVAAGRTKTLRATLAPGGTTWTVVVE